MDNETNRKTWQERVAELRARAVDVTLVEGDPGTTTVIFFGDARADDEEDG